MIFTCKDLKKLTARNFSFIFSMESILIQASQEGSVSTVNKILESNQANINCKESIWIHNSFIRFQFDYFLKFQFQIIYGIEFQDLITLLWFWLQDMVIPKLFDFFYHNQVLKSTVKTFEYTNQSCNLPLIISLYFSFR